MNQIDNMVLGAVVASVGSFLTVLFTIFKMRASFKAEVLKENKEVVEHSRQLALRDIQNMTKELEVLEQKVKALEAQFEREVEHIKDRHNTDLENLGQKISELKEEMRGQFSQLVSILTRLMDKE
jgi:peptidoglycan hydrolase CwlO-like protein